MQNEPNQDKKKKPMKISTAVMILAIIAAAVVLAVVIVSSTGSKEDNENTPQPIEEQIIYGDEDLGIDPTVDEQLQNYRNVALFGIDAKNFESETGHRSDAMIIISMNNKTDDVKMFSIYRDTYVKIDDSHGLDKLNHAYAYNGMEGSLKAINQNLDLNIREGIALTWKAVGDLVNNLGGVEIDIKDSERSYMNRSLSGENQIKSSGKQTLNGDQAVLYARIRKDSAKGDYRRNERMKIVLEAALEKAKKVETSKLLDIMDETLEEVSTNMSYNRMTDTLVDIASLNISTSIGWPYDTSGWMHNSIWYGVPITLKSNVSELHEEFFGQKDYQPTEFVQKVSDKIEKKSGYHEK
ncbi:LCP family protein [bacterium 210820-DFI.6.37]|nr:LCP family protein [bacterium 210820-DFI.6.37]